MPSSVSFFCFHTSFRSWNFSVAAAWSSGLALSGWCSAAFFRYAFLIWSGVACGEEREKKREKGECNFWWAGIFFLFSVKKNRKMLMMHGVCYPETGFCAKAVRPKMWRYEHRAPRPTADSSFVSSCFLTSFILALFDSVQYPTINW